MSSSHHGKFPDYRPRRMRHSDLLRRMTCETRFHLDQLVMPYFVREGDGVREAINAMPGQFRFSVDTLMQELEELLSFGIHNILLFGIPDEKNDRATSAWSRQGIVQRTINEIKKEFPNLLIMTDVCLCGYMNHGHCGVINSKGEVDNDASLKILADVALSHAEAGADMVAPSDMMDGRIRAIRTHLDEKHLSHIPIMSYAAKYASAFYGPFREAAHSSPQPGKYAVPSDRKSYQMDPANREEALREIGMDIEEGADMVMVKPALSYLDILREAKNRYQFPMAAYSVSGEYSMIVTAADQGLVHEQSLVTEVLQSIFRAGASTVITYHAKKIAEWQFRS